MSVESRFQMFRLALRYSKDPLVAILTFRLATQSTDSFADDSN